VCFLLFGVIKKKTKKECVVGERKKKLVNEVSEKRKSE